MAFTLPPLPYSKNALAPYISEQTIDFHYGKHHQTYVTNLNNLLQGTENESKTLEEIVNMSFAKPDMVGVFNNSAQVWNHTFFWNCMKAAPAVAPTGALAAAINNSFGSMDAFKSQFADAAKNRFGSGWAWLVVDADKKLAIGSTSNQDNPLMDVSAFKGFPLLGIDVWEHAYYLKYQNKRADYITAWCNLVNWDFVAARYEKAMQ